MLVFKIAGSVRANSDVTNRHGKRYLYAGHLGSIQCEHAQGKLSIILVTAHWAHRNRNISRVVAGPPVGSVRVDTVAPALHGPWCWLLEPFIISLWRLDEVEALAQITIEAVEIAKQKNVAELSKIDTESKWNGKKLKKMMIWWVNRNQEWSREKTDEKTNEKRISDYFEDIYKLRKVDFYFFRCWMFDEKKNSLWGESGEVKWLMGEKFLLDSDSICKCCVRRKDDEQKEKACGKNQIFVID